MLDEHVLLDLKFPHFWFENTPQGKYMLANEFNASKQYVDNLSLNTKRGLREKVRRGEMPGVVPVGCKRMSAPNTAFAFLPKTRCQHENACCCRDTLD
jgi:hypothetical protein